MKEWFLSLADGFSQTFIEDGRWVLFAKGFGVTIRVAVLALLMGIAIGILVAIVRTKHDTRKKKAHGVGNVILNILNAICQVYLTVIRGTPMMVQLMIMYFVIFASSRHSVAVATLAFGINSGAYVAEIVRGGIMSVDAGQMEAGRSLGMNYTQTMRHIIKRYFSDDRYRSKRFDESSSECYSGYISATYAVYQYCNYLSCMRYGIIQGACCI